MLNSLSRFYREPEHYGDIVMKRQRIRRMFCCFAQALKCCARSVPAVRWNPSLHGRCGSAVCFPSVLRESFFIVKMLSIKSFYYLCKASNNELRVRVTGGLVQQAFIKLWGLGGYSFILTHTKFGVLRQESCPQSPSFQTATLDCYHCSPTIGFFIPMIFNIALLQSVFYHRGNYHS